MKKLFIKLLLFSLCIIYSRVVIAQNSYVDSLKKVLQTEKEDTNKVNTLDYLSASYWQDGDYNNALQYARAVLALSTKINYKIGIGDGYLYIGLAYNIEKDRINETEYFNKALAAYKETGDKQQIIYCYGYMKEAYIGEENAEKALECVYAAQKVIEETGDKKMLADGFLNIASTLYNTGNNNWDEELKNEFSALRLYKELGDTSGVGNCYFMIGGDYYYKGKYAEALDKYTEALQLLKNTGQLNDIANIYALIGYVYESYGDSAYNKGNKSSATNNYLIAEKNELISLEKWKAVPFKPSVALCFYHLGYLNTKLENLKVARKYFDSSLAITQSLGLKRGMSGAYSGIARLDSIDGNYKDAYKNYKLYSVYYDSVNNEESTKKSVQVQMRYEFDKKESIAKAEQLKKDAEAKLKNYQQFFILLVVIAIALIQYVSKKKKQKANLLLQQQKEKVESTLADLKSTQAQLIQSEKMASLGELTAGIAHEIQNPLNFVNNFSEVNTELIEELKTELATGNQQSAIEIADDIKENEQKINHHGKRADAIVKGMLQHSRSSTGVKEPTNINALADEYLRLAYHGLRAKDKSFNAILKTDFDNSIDKINIIPQDIGRVLLNLYNNAFYAVNEKAKNPYPLKGQQEYEPIVSVITKYVKSPSGGLGVELTVKDNGNGIPQKVVDKIFQPFFTTKPTGEGTGLGLSLSYDIIKAHGGEIKVETKEGEGTAFIIHLPI